MRDQEKEIKEGIKQNIGNGLYSISIIIGLVVGIGGSAIYDMVIRPHASLEWLFIVITLFLVFYFIKVTNDSDKRLKKLEHKLKHLKI